MGLPEQILDAVSREVRRQRRDTVRWATVTTASPLQVTFPGDSAAVGVSRLAGYAPTAGEQCVLVKAGSRWVAIGDVA